ncbi:hypothetical protein EIP86_003728 [Pleurotus ostreatoroseus]|nr:hypothetical protein EIP86_003728 [Pleurotus ostreatoroseus]
MSLRLPKVTLEQFVEYASSADRYAILSIVVDDNLWAAQKDIGSIGSSSYHDNLNSLWKYIQPYSSIKSNGDGQMVFAVDVPVPAVESKHAKILRAYQEAVSRYRGYRLRESPQHPASKGVQPGPSVSSAARKETARADAPKAREAQNLSAPGTIDSALYEERITETAASCDVPIQPAYHLLESALETLPQATRSSQWGPIDREHSFGLPGRCVNPVTAEFYRESLGQLSPFDQQRRQIGQQRRHIQDLRQALSVVSLERTQLVTRLANGLAGRDASVIADNHALPGTSATPIDHRDLAAPYAPRRGLRGALVALPTPTQIELYVNNSSVVSF